MQERWKEKRRFLKRGLNWSSVWSTIFMKSQFIWKRKREPFHTPSCTIWRQCWTRANVCSQRKTYVLKTRTCQYRCRWRTLWIEIQNISAAKIQKNLSGNSGRRSFEGLLPSEKRYSATTRRIVAFGSKTNALVSPRWTSRCPESCGRSLKKCRCCTCSYCSWCSWCRLRSCCSWYSCCSCGSYCSWCSCCSWRSYRSCCSWCSPCSPCSWCRLCSCGSYCSWCSCSSSCSWYGAVGVVTVVAVISVASVVRLVGVVSVVVVVTVVGVV